MTFSEEHRQRARERVRELRDQGFKFPSNPEDRFRQAKSQVGSKPYMRLAISANCYDCVGREPNYRRLISGCEVATCPFHELRPYKPSSDLNTSGKPNEEKKHE